MYAILGAVSLVLKGNLFLPVLALLGATIGIPMTLSFPFSIEQKMMYVAILTASFSAMVFGVLKRNKLLGQIAAVLGFLCWSLAGISGVGTVT